MLLWSALWHIKKVCSGKYVQWMWSFYPDFQGSTYCDSSLLHTNRWYPTCVCVGILFSWEMSFLKLCHDAISMRMESLVTSGLGSTADSPGLNFTSTASIHPSVKPKQPQRDLRRQPRIYILSLLLSVSVSTNAQGSRLCLSPLPSSACCLFICRKYVLCRRNSPPCLLKLYITRYRSTL